MVRSDMFGGDESNEKQRTNIFSNRHKNPDPLCCFFKYFINEVFSIGYADVIKCEKIMQKMKRCP